MSERVGKQIGYRGSNGRPPLAIGSREPQAVVRSRGVRLLDEELKAVLVRPAVRKDCELSVASWRACDQVVGAVRGWGVRRLQVGGQ